jgi:hypothetical protein
VVGAGELHAHLAHAQVEAPEKKKRRKRFDARAARRETAQRGVFFGVTRVDPKRDPERDA